MNMLLFFLLILNFIIDRILESYSYFAVSILGNDLISSEKYTICLVIMYFNRVICTKLWLYQVGLSFTAAYFVYQMKSGTRNIFVELLIAVLASFALGFGTLFIMLSFGLYI